MSAKVKVKSKDLKFESRTETNLGVNLCSGEKLKFQANYITAADETCTRKLKTALLSYWVDKICLVRGEGWQFQKKNYQETRNNLSSFSESQEHH